MTRCAAANPTCSTRSNMPGRGSRYQGEAKGEVKSRIKGQVEIVEGLLKVGVTWEVIEAATGLNEVRFQVRKEQLSESGS